jgi:hypothetical protein
MKYVNDKLLTCLVHVIRKSAWFELSAIAWFALSASNAELRITLFSVDTVRYSASTIPIPRRKATKSGCNPNIFRGK